MNLEVCVENAFVVCLEGAVRTHVAPHPCVDPHVSAEDVFVRGTVGAIRAGERPGSRV